MRHASRRLVAPSSVMGLALAFATACAPNDAANDAGSEVKHLTPGMPQCAVDEDRAKELAKDLGPYTSGPANLSQYLFQQVSMLPSPYTDYLVKRARGGALRIQVNAGFGGGIAGLTTGGFDGTEPSLIQFPPVQESIRQAALHEFGHALQSFTFRNADLGPREASMTNAALQKAVASADARSMWSYARSNRYEYWASAFSQYYCSPAARETMKNAFPATYEFMGDVVTKAEAKMGVGQGGEAGPAVRIALRDEGDDSRLVFAVAGQGNAAVEYCEGDAKACNLTGAFWQPTESIAIAGGKALISRREVSLTDAKTIMVRVTVAGSSSVGSFRFRRIP